MIYWELFYLFFKIGLFSFGGGYALVAMIQSELAVRGWSTAEEFANIVAISQMTPGPLGINAATYIGYTVGGVFGSVVATFSVILPSFILMILASHFLKKFQENRFVVGVLGGIRPVTVALILCAGVVFLKMSPIGDALTILKSIAIFGIAVLCSTKIKIGAVWLVLLSAVLGIILY